MVGTVTVGAAQNCHKLKLNSDKITLLRALKLFFYGAPNLTC